MKIFSHNFKFRIYAIAVAALAWSLNIFASIVLVDTETRKAFELYQAGNIEQAIPLITIKAYEGVTAAQYNLAVIYSKDQDNQLSQKEFRFWLNKAAESGDAESQFNMAMLYYRDWEDGRRLEKTVTWLTKSAKNGYAKAQYNLGYLGFSNLETGVSRQNAAEWLLKAAKANNDRAKIFTGLLQENNLEGAPKLYSINLQFRAETKKVVYATKHDGTEIYAFPATRQKSLLVLKKNVKVEVAERHNDWLGVRVEGGFPSWIASEELNLRGKTATVTGLEASMYVEPVVDHEVFKIGVVNREETLRVIGHQNGWVKVTTPDYFLAWVKESDIVVKKGVRVK